MLLIRGATLIDGTGRPPVEDSAILIEEDRIKWIGTAAVLDMQSPVDSIVDAQGKYLIPGLIDAHTHFTWDGRAPLHQIADRCVYDAVLIGMQQLARILNTGVTAVRDVGGDRHADIFLKNAVNRGEVTGPRVMVSGNSICRTGGHAYFSDVEADGVEGMRQAVREEIKAGADLVKIMVTGGVATPGQDIHIVQLTDEEIRVATDEAHRWKLVCAAHCHGVNGIKAAVRNGVDTIEHGLWTDEEAADLMAQYGSLLVMTIKPPNDPVHVPGRLHKYMDRDDLIRNVIGLLRDRKVPIALGCDVITHGDGMPFVMHRVVECGMSPLEAIVAATLNGAKAMHWEDRVGSIEVGKYADLVLLNSDPLLDIGHVRDISQVYRGGKPVPRPVIPVSA